MLAAKLVKCVDDILEKLRYFLCSLFKSKAEAAGAGAASAKISSGDYRNRSTLPEIFWTQVGPSLSPFDQPLKYRVRSQCSQTRISSRFFPQFWVQLQSFS